MFDDSARIRHVASQLLHELVGVRECDVGVQVSDERELQSLLVQVTFEVEQEGLDAKLSTSESGTVADG